mmetsp:Transcript_16259/g.33447  ORF Transcript_16259/g.33447 Transcript_16259/m.33447 type:complete len:1396 (-) Transcript_16259:49-4236(-)
MGILRNPKTSPHVPPTSSALPPTFDGFDVTGRRNDMEVHEEEYDVTQTDHDDGVRGMVRKWDRHFYGRMDVFWKVMLVGGIVIAGVCGMLWVQFLFIWSFNSKIIFSAILDQNDQWSLDQTYVDFVHKKNDRQTSLTSFYLWNVTNAEQVITIGDKPNVREVGPFGYIKNTYKYSVTFHPPDSHYVTYSQYSYYTPTQNPVDCYHMFFRMDKAVYSSQQVDCPGETCYCRNEEEMVNVINPKFMQVMEKEKPWGIMGLLSQEVFAEYKEVFTTSFVDSLKFSFLPKFMRSVFNFRNQSFSGKTFGDLINKLIASKGESWVIEHFTHSHLDDKIPMEDCEPLKVPNDKSQYCPFGSANFIASFAQTNVMSLTINESRIVLGLDPAWPNASPFKNGEDGILRWINAAVYLELIEETLLDKDVVRQEAEDSFWEISNECETWDGASKEYCYYKVKGICEMMFNMWTWSPYNKAFVNEEWKNAPLNSVKCDTRGNTCAWELDKYNTDDISTEVIADFIDPYRAATWNDLSLYKEENLNNFRDIFDHCKAKADGEPYSCPAMSAYEELATVTYPATLDGTTPDSKKVNYTTATFESMSCSLASWLFRGWGLENEFVNRAVATWFNLRWPSDDDMYGQWTADNLHLLGYSQWGNGIPTKLVYKVPSTNNLKRLGIWRFSKKGTQLNLPEYYARTQKWAYPMMNMTTSQTKVVLDALAEDSVEAYELRSHIMYVGTTAMGNGTSYENGFGDKGDIGFILENAYADFKLPKDHKYYDVSEWMDLSYMSSSKHCATIDNHYEKCQLEIDKFKKFWPARCGIWKTLALDPAFGIQCNDVRIWTNSHPYPKKNGNVIEAFITDVLWEETLRKQLLVCSNPSYVQNPQGYYEADCSYDKGGMFIMAKARDILFEGFTDPLTIKIMNSKFKMLKKGYQIVCNNQVEVSYHYKCGPIYDPQCGDGGFSVIHETEGVLKNMTRNTVDWYLPDIDLGAGFGTIDNPVFAAYSGGLFKDKQLEQNVTTTSRTVESVKAGSISAKANFNETENVKWQKHRNCLRSYMGGPGNIYPNCTVTMETGRDDLKRLGRIVNFHGNDTLHLYNGNTFKVDGNSLLEGDYNNFSPLLWEAFREFNLNYQGRMSGLDYKGNATQKIFIGEEMIQFVIPNIEKWDGKNPTSIRWPMRYRFLDNTTTESLVYALRHEVDKASWDTNRYTNFSINEPERDYFGMPFTVPPGMSSTRAQSGYLTFVGTPHHYGNAEWGGNEWNQLRGMDGDKLRHNFFFDLEPISGEVMRIAKRLQVNIRVERGALLHQIISSQARCPVPNKNSFSELAYGCAMYVPLLWYDDQRIYEQDKTLKFQEEILSYPKVLATMTSGSVAVSVVMGVIAILVWVRQKKRFAEFKTRIFLE